MCGSREFYYFSLHLSCCCDKTPEELKLMEELLFGLMVKEGIPSFTTGKQCTREKKAEVYMPPTVI